MKEDETELSFGKWRRRLLPIHSYEFKKFIPLLLIKFFVTFIYTILRDTKDTLIVTSAGSGAEAIPVLKGWIVLPLAFLAMLIYSRLSHKLSRSALFYSVMAFFLSFFFLFAFVLYPYRELLIPHQSADWLQSVLGDHRSHWVAVYRYWMNSLFFFIAELWGGIGIGMIFWGFVIQVTAVSEAKRFYTLFSAGGNSAVIIAGPLIWYYSHSYIGQEFEITLRYLLSFALFFGFCIICCYWWVNRYVLTDEEKNQETKTETKKEKPKISFWQSIKLLTSSRYLASIAIMVIAYGLAFNLVEVSWKATLKLQYPNPGNYQSFMGIITFSTGVVSLFTTIFFGGVIMRRWGWFTVARLTPLLVGVVGSTFLLLFAFKETISPFLLSLGISPFFLIIGVGAVQNVLGKTTKYSFFDPTKEMAFIPLDLNSKVKGKAAIDVVGARLGKSNSSWIQLILLELFGTGSILGLTAYLAPFVVGTVVIWFCAVYSLNRRFSKLQKGEITPLEAHQLSRQEISTKEETSSSLSQATETTS